MGWTGLDDEAFDRIDDMFGTDIADGVDYNVKRMHDGSDTASHHEIPGIGHDPDSLAAYFASWKGRLTHRGTKSGAQVAYDSDRGVLLVKNDSNIHGYQYPQGSFNGRRYVTK